MPVAQLRTAIAVQVLQAILLEVRPPLLIRPSQVSPSLLARLIMPSIHHILIHRLQRHRRTTRRSLLGQLSRAKAQLAILQLCFLRTVEQGLPSSPQLESRLLKLAETPLLARLEVHHSQSQKLLRNHRRIFLRLPLHLERLLFCSQQLSLIQVLILILPEQRLFLSLT